MGGTSFLSKKGRGKKQWPAGGEIFSRGVLRVLFGGRGQIWLSRGLAILVVRGVWTPPGPPRRKPMNSIHILMDGCGLRMDLGLVFKCF